MSGRKASAPIQRRKLGWSHLATGGNVRLMNEEDFTKDELLEVPQIAHYLRVSDVTIYRWCREGRLPCLKLGNTWRIRRSAMEDFLARGERSATLVGQLRSFYRVPDNVLASAQSKQRLHQLDDAFFRVGEARGGMLAKFLGPETGASVEELRSDWGGAGLEVERLEAEGRLRFVAVEKAGDHAEALRRYYEEVVEVGRTIWVSIDWAVGVDLEEALRRQRKLTSYVADRQLVVQTGILERATDEWALPVGRQAQLAHTATVWLTEVGLATTRASPLAEG
jgi:excisionase family DNA binding protein